MNQTPESLNINLPKAARAGDFKKKRNANPLILLPASGLHVRVKRPGMEKFLSAGFLPDSLASQIRKMIEKRQGKVEQQLQDMPEVDTDTVLTMVNRIAAYVFVDPPVLWHQRAVKSDSNEVPEVVAYEEIPDDERDQDSLYTDELELEDKMFVFNYAVGGSADIAQFRDATRDAVDALLPGGEVVNQTE